MLSLAALTPVCRAQASLAGDWKGEWSISGGQLRFVLHIKAAPDGRLSATLDSLDQGKMGVPVTSMSFKDAQFTFWIASSRIRYVGVVNEAETKIHGTITQSQPLPLNFTRQLRK
jgi:hypothetical protein